MSCRSDADQKKVNPLISKVDRLIGAYFLVYGTLRSSTEAWLLFLEPNTYGRPGCRCIETTQLKDLDKHLNDQSSYAS